MDGPRLVDVGGYRLWINCVGEGSPTVVFENGWSKQPQAPYWRAVRKQVSASTRTCVYERAGVGESEPRPAGTISAQQDADELERLLSNAGIAPPYVVVSHSFGGVIARIFAADHPDEVPGMVFVDAATEWFYDANGWKFGWEGGSHVNLQESAAEVSRVTSLGAIPIVVLEEGHGSPLPGPGWDAVWARAQRSLAGLSTDAELVQAPTADHYIQLDSPKIVIASVQEVVTAVRTGSALRECESVFSRVGGRCL